MRRMDWNSIGVLAGFFAVCFVTASSGAIFSPGPWYENLAKPSWCPPNWLFPPAWTILFITIAVAGWLVWRAAGFEGAETALIVYAVQLVLNFAWSALFFGLRRPDLAFAEVLAFWVSILATILTFHAIDATAGWLLEPYLAWVSFASVLNFSIWRRNRTAPVAARA